MRKKGQKLTAIMLGLAMTAGVTACGDKNTGTDPTPQPTKPADTQPTTAAGGEDTPQPTEPAVTEVPEKYRDLGGIDILIADWWTGEEGEPQTAQEEATREYRREIQEKYHFTIKQARIGEWGEHQETFTLGTMANDPAGQIFCMDQGFVAKPFANNLFYNLSSLETLDFTEEKWNQTVLDLMTAPDGNIYGMATGKPEPRCGVFWNKRLFEEAGLERDLLYDLQAKGEWTWDKLEELCGKLTRDIDGDGTIDTYAMMSFSPDFFNALIVCNNAKYIGVDSNGNYYNDINTPQFLEALQFGVKLLEKGYEMRAPEGAQWDYFLPAFHDAKVAMTFGEEFRVGTWADMDDDFGFVMAPAGPQGISKAVYKDNIFVIPSCYTDTDYVNKIAFAYNLYTNPTPGYEDDDDWMNGYYPRFRDARAVDETLTMMYEEGRGETWYLPAVYGISYGDIVFNIYGLWQTPAEKIEEVNAKWQSLIDDANMR
ncbi:MAG: ABC transporter substrate-binding protein [Lachnospiraceae bacterium]|nr:ABC transporter substrate-binding protein [Lachnospiraceae bacterium]